MAKPKLLNMNGAVIPYEDARVHVLSTAMKYAASVYEAMRAYWSDADQQLYVFQLREHLRRLEQSAKIARIPLPADPARFAREVLEVIRANDLHEDLHVRLIVFVDTDDGGLASRGSVGPERDSVGTPSAAAMCSGPELLPRKRSATAMTPISPRTSSGPVRSASGVAAPMASARASSPGPATTRQAAPMRSVSRAITSAKRAAAQRCDS